MCNSIHRFYIGLNNLEATFLNIILKKIFKVVFNTPLWKTIF